MGDEGLEPRPLRYKQDGSLLSDQGKRQVETYYASLVSPMVSLAEPQLNVLTAELMAIWSQLNDDQQLVVLNDLRIRFSHVDC